MVLMVFQEAATEASSSRRAWSTAASTAPRSTGLPSTAVGTTCGRAGQIRPDLGSDPAGQRGAAGPAELAAEHHQPGIEYHRDRRHPGRHPAGQLAEELARPPVAGRGRCHRRVHGLARGWPGEAERSGQRQHRLRADQGLECPGRGVTDVLRQRHARHRKVADLARRAGRAAVQPPAEHGRQPEADADPDEHEVVGAADGGPDRALIIVVRDAHRHPAARAAVDRLLSARPDAVVVEMGLPGWRPPAARSYLATYGAARTSGQAAAEILGLTTPVSPRYVVRRVRPAKPPRPR
jgi:hypothetical protein